MFGENAHVQATCCELDDMNINISHITAATSSQHSIVCYCIIVYELVYYVFLLDINLFCSLIVNICIDMFMIRHNDMCLFVANTQTHNNYVYC